jgi:ribosome-associated protein
VKKAASMPNLSAAAVTEPAPELKVVPAVKPKAAPRPRKAAASRPASGVDAPPHSIGLPKRPRPVRKTAASARLDMARRIVALAEDKKAADILLLDLDGLTTLADAFVICSGGSERQLESIANGIIRGMRAEGIRPIGKEGLPASHWMLVDFGDVIVHIFTPPERDYYGLEKHWSEAKAILRVQ